MTDQIIIRELNALSPAQQEMVKTFIEFLAQKNDTVKNASSATSLQDKHPPLKAGFLKGTFSMKDDFDEPLDDFKEYM